MKWWLRLYTIPTLKKLVYMSLFCIALDALAAFFGVKEVELIAFVYFAPIIFVWACETQQGMVRNLEFHKATLPFPEIVKALIGHYSLLIFCTLFVSFSLGGLSQLLGGAAKSLFFLPLPSTAIAAFIAVVLISGFILTLSKPFFKQSFMKFKAHFLVRFVISFFLTMTFLMVIIGFVFVGMSSDAAMVVAMGGVFIASTSYHWRSMFHIIPNQASIKHYLKYNLLGLGSACAMFLICAFIGQNDHMNLSNSPAERAVSLMTWQPLSGHIDMLTFQELEPHVSILDVGDFYRIAPENVGHIPIKNFIDSRRTDRLVSFLSYAKPSKKNYHDIAAHLEKNKEQWKKVDPKGSIIMRVAYDWPKDLKVPDYLVEAKVKRKTKRAVASEK